MSVEVVSIAVPLLTAPVPRVLEPSKNVTTPVAFAGMVAVKVTG